MSIIRYDCVGYDAGMQPVNGGNWVRHHDHEKALREARMKVKPLVWEGDEAEDHDLTAHPDPYHHYTVRKLGETRFDVILNHELGSLWFKIVKDQVWTDYASAKAAAQADYERRILSAIDTTDLNALIGAVLAEAAKEAENIGGIPRRMEHHDPSYTQGHETAGIGIAGVILALHPAALTALDRAIEDAILENNKNNEDWFGMVHDLWSWILDQPGGINAPMKEGTADAVLENFKAAISAMLREARGEECPH